MTIDRDDVDVGDLNVSNEYDDGELILFKLRSVMDYIQSKGLNGRICKEDKLRLDWFKAFFMACKVFNEIRRDVEMDELREEVEEIKRALNNK